MKLMSIALVAVFSLLAQSSVAAPAHGNTGLTVKKDKNGYLLVLKPGDKVMQSLVEFARKENLPGAQLAAVGALKNVQVSYYNLEKKAYQTQTFEPSGEVVSFTGNLGWFEKNPVAHAHVSLAGPDFHIYGGHLQEAEVSLTLEVFVTPTTYRIEREANTEFASVKTIKH